MKEKLIFGFIAISIILSAITTPMIIVSVFFISKNLGAGNYESAGFWVFIGIITVISTLKSCEKIFDYMNENRKD